jgi:hypothetical protein
MFLWTSIDRRVRRLGLLDVKLAQGAAMCLAVILVKLFPVILEVDTGWLIALALLLALRPMIHLYGREG